MNGEAQRINVLDATCPSRRVLDLVADKWSVLVLHALKRGTHRHGELQRMIGGISQKMLTQTLRELEHNGLLTRKIYPVVPPMVEYTLTPLGNTLADLMRGLCLWAEEHWHEVEAARNGCPDATINAESMLLAAK